MISAFAPAKLNLYLHVTGQRADGYHTLDSLVAFADVGDHIEITPASEFSLTITGAQATGLQQAPIDQNIITRVTYALATQLGRAPAVAITLKKNLPIASGIGGGSTDAAATLRALAQLWELEKNDPRLFAIAAATGKDIPVCLAANTQYFGDAGEKLDPGPTLPPCHLVLVNPGVAVHTPAVFKARQGGFSPPARFTESPASPAALAAMLAKRRNDLTAAAVSLAPEIKQVLTALGGTTNCLLARMLGSGATCFGLYIDEAAAARAAEDLTTYDRNWWVVKTLIPQHSCA
jgi:4-diphosphocytidyl-2-C-methyl-D-erythritol kinase